MTNTTKTTTSTTTTGYRELNAILDKARLVACLQNEQPLWGRICG
jgi:hypothetical protein